MPFEDLIHGIVSKRGLKVLADEVGCDIATLSRFQNNQGGLKLSQIQRLLNLADAVVVPRRKYEGIVNSWLTASEFARDLLEKNHDGQ